MRLDRPLAALAAFAVVLSITPLTAQTIRGVTASEIRIGQTMPYSGPVSAFAQIAKSAEAYFRKINDEGGVNGRRIQMMIADDAYSPPKTVEQTRRLVESDEVLLIFGAVGTPTAEQRATRSDEGPLGRADACRAVR